MVSKFDNSKKPSLTTLVDTLLDVTLNAYQISNVKNFMQFFGILLQIILFVMKIVSNHISLRDILQH